MRLILASASPRRAELLRAAGFEFETRAVEVDEAVRLRETPQAYVRRLAMEKSAKAMESVDRDDVIVLAADTAVVIHHENLRKPRGHPPPRGKVRRPVGGTHRKNN